MIVIIPLVIVAGVLAWLLRPKGEQAKPVSRAITGTLIPPVAVTVASIIAQLIQNASGTVEVSYISGVLLMVGLGMITAAVMSSAVFAVMRKWDITKGIGFSICVAAIVFIMGLFIVEWLGGV